MSGLGGTSTHPMDKKGRVSLPSKHYKVLLDDLAVIKGPDRDFACLRIYKASEFDVLARSLLAGEEGFQQKSRSQNALKRRLFAGREEITVDAAQRILIPKHLREYASLEDTVVILGVDEYIELWNPDILAKSEQFYDEFDLMDLP
jgi:MraZ protein